MTQSAALPFVLRRSSDVIGLDHFTSTTEKLHGLLRLDGECVVIQWRTSRKTERVGSEVRTDLEYEPVREVSVPLSALAGARIRTRWWGGRQLHLTAADLRAFEGVAGEDGLRLAHPAELVLGLSRDTAKLAREFAAELQMALAERALRQAEQAQEIGGGAAPLLPADRPPPPRG
jgi:hypothetical protein